MIRIKKSYLLFSLISNFNITSCAGRKKEAYLMLAKGKHKKPICHNGTALSNGAFVLCQHFVTFLLVYL